MKIIPVNKISAPDASTEHESFTASSVADLHIDRTWQPLDTDTSPEISVNIESGDAIMVYNILADSITITIKTLGGSTIKSQTWDLTQSDDVGDYNIKKVWMEYTEQTSTHTAEISLTKTTVSYIQIGVIFAGKSITLPDPYFGNLSFAPVNHSVVYDMEYGHDYIIDGNMQEIIPVKLIIRDDAETFWMFKRMVDRVGLNAFACKLLDNDDTDRYLIIGRFDSMPGFNPPRSETGITGTSDFTLKEFL